MFADMGLQQECAVVQALRHASGDGKGQYSSNAIIGQDVTLEEFCDAIATAGVLTVEPGMFSYGLGNLVLGRVIEIVVAQSSGTAKKFSKIMDEMLFAPLGMSTAAFFLKDGDARIAKFPTLYGSTPDKEPKYVPYAESLPAVPAGGMVPPNTVATDSFSGPRKCESGDTGTCMTVDDFSKFYDFLHADGVAPNGERLLKSATVEALTKKRIRGLRCDNLLAQAFGVNGDGGPIPQSFRLGWCGARFPTEIYNRGTIGSHACLLEVNVRVTNGILLGCLHVLPVGTVNCVHTLKGCQASERGPGRS
jgi:CubicO group peptidase (beta-lactamase class C family)